MILIQDEEKISNDLSRDNLHTWRHWINVIIHDSSDVSVKFHQTAVMDPI